MHAVKTLCVELEVKPAHSENNNTLIVARNAVATSYVRHIQSSSRMHQCLDAVIRPYNRRIAAVHYNFASLMFSLEDSTNRSTEFWPKDVVTHKRDTTAIPDWWSQSHMSMTDYRRSSCCIGPIHFYTLFRREVNTINTNEHRNQQVGPTRNTLHCDQSM